MHITILGWEKINARKDVENPTWFKFKHKFFDDSEFFDFTHAEKVCWLYFLCQASAKNAAGKFLLSNHHANHAARLDEPTVKSTIKKLKRIGAISVRAVRERADSGTYACAREDKIREEEIRLEKKRGEPARAANAGAFISAYCSAWKSKYGARPEITGKEQGIAKRLAGAIGTERASELVAAYLLMQDRWFQQKRHDLSTFEQNLNAVVQFHDTGKTLPPDNSAYRREEGNRYALEEALKTLEARDEQAG